MHCIALSTLAAPLARGAPRRTTATTPRAAVAGAAVSAHDDAQDATTADQVAQGAVCAAQVRRARPRAKKRKRGSGLHAPLPLPPAVLGRRARRPARLVRVVERRRESPQRIGPPVLPPQRTHPEPQSRALTGSCPLLRNAGSCPPLQCEGVNSATKTKCIHPERPVAKACADCPRRK
jgi:hypothetical protein